MLCAVGDLVEDVVVWLSGPPDEGTDVGARVFRRRGGSAANVAALCAATGTPSRFVGQVGDDDLGDRLLGALAANGVELCVQRGGRTGTIVVLVAPDGERTMLTDRGSATELAPADDRWLDGADVLHLPAYSLTVGPLAATSAALARSARAQRTLVSIDASSTALLSAFGPDRFLDLLAELEPDVLFANEAEAALLELGDRAPKGVDLLVVHRGRQPATAATHDAAVAAIPPVAVAAATDSTGAGDAFAAGFLPAYRSGASVAAAITAGHRCAARTLASPGAGTEGLG